MEWVSGHQGQLRADSTSEHTVPAVYVYGGLRRMGDGDLDSYVHTMFTEAVLAVVTLSGCLPISGGKGGPSTYMLTLQSGGDSDMLENTLLKAFPSLCVST